MAKMTPLLIRLEPEHIKRLDELRGDVPRVAFIRSRLVSMLDADRAATKPSEKPRPPPSQRVIEGARIPFVKPLETAEAPAPFKSRLKGEWKPR